MQIIYIDKKEIKIKNLLKTTIMGSLLYQINILSSHRSIIRIWRRNNKNKLNPSINRNQKYTFIDTVSYT